MSDDLDDARVAEEERDTEAAGDASATSAKRRQKKRTRDPILDLLLPLSAIAAVIFGIIAIPGVLPGGGGGGGGGDIVAVTVGTTAADGSFTEVELGVSEPGSVDIGDSAPTFALQSLEGDLIQLEALRGGVVLVNFWATWCAPCRKEVPDLVILQEEWGSAATIVGVNLQEPPDSVRPFATDFAINYPIALDRDGTVTYSYKLFGLPETFFIDADGIIRDRRIGLLKADTARCIVTGMAAGAHDPQDCR